MPKNTLLYRFSLLKNEALRIIDNYKGCKSSVFQNNQRYLDNDDSYILIGRGEPLLRDKRDQRLVANGQRDEKDCDDKPLKDVFSPEEIFALADRLTASTPDTNKAE